MQTKRKNSATNSVLTESQAMRNPAVKIVMLTLTLFFIQASVPTQNDWSHSMAASTTKTVALPTTLQSGSFQFMDESSQPGGNFNTGNSPNAWIKTATNNWMAALPDTTPLKSISLPGTHDSGTRVSGLAVQTQSWTIKDQLEAGLRFLDIRTRRTKDSLAIHHSSIFLGMMFGDVMNAVSAFLASHPKEVIVMRIRADEHTAEDGSKDFATIWANYMKQYGNFIAQNTNSNPTLGSLRGKVFVLQNGWNDSTRGISYGGDTFDIQDYYQVYFLAGEGIRGTETANLPGKKKKVNEYLDRAATSTKWVLNYLSGSTGMAPPDVARATNGEAYEHIGSSAGKKNLGTVIMDFPGEQLIYRIIKSNFKGKVSCGPRVFRSVSEHSWVEFRLPQGSEGQIIEIAGGAYNKYVFPKCNRVWWSDLAFSCGGTGTWEKTRGNWDSDALCTSSPGTSPYVATGNR